MGRHVSLCERRPVLRQHGRAALQPDRPLLSPSHWQSRLDEDQPGHLRLDDPGSRRGRGARCAGHALHERTEHPEGAQSALPRRPAAKFEEAGDNPRMLLNLRKRMSRIRVFDPACGSGNFLVIAYKEMRAIEAEINERRGEPDRRTEIPLTNFRGIELRDFPAEIARLALIIAEFQCDVLYRGQKEALAEFLPLDAQNWITCGNALRLDWLSICPPTGTGVKFQADDLFFTPRPSSNRLRQSKVGKPTSAATRRIMGATWQSKSKNRTSHRFRWAISRSALLDYVIGWFLKASDYGSILCRVVCLCFNKFHRQGEQVAHPMAALFKDNRQICLCTQIILVGETSES